MESTIKIAPDGELDTAPDAYAVTVAETQDGARFMEIRDGELSGGNWIFYPDEDRYGWAMEFQKEKDGRLFVGLWAETGGFDFPEDATKNVPVPVAVEGQDAIAAYLLIGAGTAHTRKSVAAKLGVTEQTVSNYASRIRWTGETNE